MVYVAIKFGYRCIGRLLPRSHLFSQLPMAVRPLCRRSLLDNQHPAKRFEADFAVDQFYEFVVQQGLNSASGLSDPLASIALESVRPPCA